MHHATKRDYQKKKNRRMDSQQEFNTYKEGLDLTFLRQHCMDNGVLRSFERGELFAVAGRPSRWIGYVTKGCFKYVVSQGNNLRQPEVTLTKDNKHQKEHLHRFLSLLLTG